METKERLRITFEMPSNGKLRQFTVTNEDELALGLTRDHRTCLIINDLYIDIDLEFHKAREVIKSAKVEAY
nr:MAG TPA: Seven transmembrane helix receptor, peptide, ECD1, Agonist, Family B1 [Caudoviricetes sp.]